MAEVASSASFFGVGIGKVHLPAFTGRLGRQFAWVSANLLTAAGYFALGGVVNGFFTAYGLFPAPIWLPAALAMVAAIGGGVRLFPGIFVGSLAVNAVLFAPPLPVTMIISLTNALGPIAAAFVLRRLLGDSGAFTSFAGVIRFLCCTMLLGPAISAAGGTLAMLLGEPFTWSKAYSVWVGWWLCDASGTLYLAPALLLWLGIEREAETDGGGSARPVPRWRHLPVWGGIAAASAILFLTPPLKGGYLHSFFPFLLVMPVSWVALRMSLRSACTLVSLVAVIAAVGTVAGLGPFAADTLANPLQLVGLLVLVLAMNVLTIVALVGELRGARQESRGKAMFLARTSHELRTPLNAIIGFSSMIDQEVLGPLANAKYAEYARIINVAGEHLKLLIDDLIDLSKIEAGRFVLSDNAVPVREPIEDAANLIAVQARAKSIVLGVHVAADLDTVTADPRALRQIVINLVNNAVKFTTRGGTVSVSAERSRAGSLVIRIRDTGVGIPAAALERVFEPFERLHAVEAEGNGLGLSITRGLVVLHGGTIELASEPGCGTTATVTLPAWRLAAAAPPVAVPQAAE